MALHLTFGGAPGPYEWGVVSESICDLSIAIMQDGDWDPSKLRAPDGCHVPPPKILDDAVPFAEGKELIVDVPVNSKGIADVYIDDMIALAVNVENSDNIQRLEQVTLLTIHCAARDKHANEPIPREGMAARAEFIAKAGAEEVKATLGWICDFISFYSSPRKQMCSMEESDCKHHQSKAGCTSYKEFEKVIGRCIHLGIPFSQVHHFMRRMRGLLRRAKKRRVIKLNDMVIEDLKLMLFFLDKASKGVDMNLLVYRKKNNKNLQI